MGAIQQSDDPAVQDLHPERTIYVHGCMTVLGRRLRRDVLPLLLTYIGCAVLLALIQILSLVLARWVALMSTMIISSLVLFYFVLWPCCNNLCRIPSLQRLRSCHLAKEQASRESSWPIRS